MPWVRFVADHDFSPAAKNGWVTVAYKKGTVDNVTRECAGQALALGRAEPAQPERMGVLHVARRRKA